MPGGWGSDCPRRPSGKKRPEAGLRVKNISMGTPSALLRLMLAVSMRLPQSVLTPRMGLDCTTWWPVSGSGVMTGTIRIIMPDHPPGIRKDQRAVHLKSYEVVLGFIKRAGALQTDPQMTRSVGTFALLRDFAVARTWIKKINTDSFQLSPAVWTCRKVSLSVDERGPLEIGDVKPPEEFSFPLGEVFKSSGMISENLHSGKITKEEGRAIVGLPSFPIL